VPRQWVIAVQVYRVEGVIFLILYASNLLPGMFAVPAGAGDVAVGLLALAIGIDISGRQQIRSRTVLLCNLFGISVFPLVLIPTFLVPLAIVLHIISLVPLGRATAQTDSGRELVPVDHAMLWHPIHAS
jgi:fatty acid desaturase